MKSLQIIILILLSSFYLFSLGEESNVKFTWGILYKNESGETRLADIEDDVKLKQSDKFKIYLQPDDSTYLYLFYLSSEGDLTVLFPDKKSLDYGSSWGSKSNLLIPGSTEWFQLNLTNPDDADKVYLLASNKQIKDLDILIKKYLDSQDNDIKDKIVQKITLVIKEHSQFASYSIKPTSTAGGTRAITLMLEGYFQEISAKDFYARVFEIKY